MANFLTMKQVLVSIFPRAPRRISCATSTRPCRFSDSVDIYEASYASWNGPDHADAFGLARGIRWERTADEYLSLTVGLSHISRITNNLGQPFEFYGRLAYEKNVDKALFSIG